MLDRLTARITRMVKASQTTLTRVFGIGPINAAVILAEVGNIDRFPTRNHLASYAGTAPIEVSSGDNFATGCPVRGTADPRRADDPVDQACPFR